MLQHVTISGGGVLTEAGVSVLKRLPELRSIQVLHPITTKVAQRITAVTNVRQLRFFSNVNYDQGPGDVGYAALAKHSTLEELQIHGHGQSPTDAALQSLAKLPKLRTFKLEFSEEYNKRNYTAAGVARFRELRPDVHLTVDGVDYPAIVTTGAAAEDPQRRAAEMVLARGGSLNIFAPQQRSITRRDELPLTRFAIDMVNLNSADSVTDFDLSALRSLPIRRAYLNRTKLSDEGLRFLLENDAIQILEIGKTNVTDDGMALLSQARDLESLMLGDIPITNAGCEHLARLANLRHLRLGSSEITDAGLKWLSQMRNLYSLGLNSANVTAPGVTALSSMENLQLLELRDCRLDDSSVTYLAKFKRLREMDLTGTQISGAGAQRLQSLLPDCFIRHSALATREADVRAAKWALEHGGRVSDAYHGDLQQIPEQQFAVSGISFYESRTPPSSGTKNLAGLRSIESLNWRGLTNTQTELVRLGKLFSLRGLHLGASDLTDTGLGQLKNLDQLEQLYLDSCQNLTDEGLKTLTSFQHLTYLSLSRTSITDAGFAELSRIRNLRALDVSYCPNIDGSGIEALANMKRLRQLSLSGTALADTAISHLKQFQRLRFLNISKTNITAAGAAELQQALPNCVVFHESLMNTPWRLPASDVPAEAEKPSR